MIDKEYENPILPVLQRFLENARDHRLIEEDLLRKGSNFRLLFFQYYPGGLINLQRVVMVNVNNFYVKSVGTM